VYRDRLLRYFDRGRGKPTRGSLAVFMPCPPARCIFLQDDQDVACRQRQLACLIIPEGGEAAYRCDMHLLLLLLLLLVLLLMQLLLLLLKGGVVMSFPDAGTDTDRKL
jgi:hypothetical protein